MSEVGLRSAALIPPFSDACHRSTVRKCLSGVDTKQTVTCPNCSDYSLTCACCVHTAQESQNKLSLRMGKGGGGREGCLYLRSKVVEC